MKYPILCKTSHHTYRLWDIDYAYDINILETWKSDIITGFLTKSQLYDLDSYSETRLSDEQYTILQDSGIVED